jgi:peptide/nickel transport system ATP-binding protein/oligopeptide transport system ATP-binding protein
MNEVTDETTAAGTATPGQAGASAAAGAGGSTVSAAAKGTGSGATLAPEPTHENGSTPGRPTILEVDELQMYFPVKNSGIIRRTVGHVQAVDGVSFEVEKGQALGLVGESGCGKSTTGRLITRLLTPTGGQIRFEGRDIAKLSPRELKPLRRDIQMIFQDPYTSLNPRHTVGSIVAAPLEIHKIVPRKQILPRVQELLEIVGLNPEHYNRYPNEFSGGQRQRIGIARALTLNPKLLVADEPVSALDVSIQAQVINLLQDLQKEFDISFLFIAHDLAVVRHFCPEVAVMYLGKIVEVADRDTLYNRPHHPYTQALLSAVPDVKQAAIGGRRERIRLEGDVPSPINPPSGCRFRTRCPIAQDICAKVVPPLLQIGPRHKVACHFAGEVGKHPAKPVFNTALGTDEHGDPAPGATPMAGLVEHPGFADSWFDIATQKMES